MSEPRYASPQALRQAIKDRLTTLASRRFQAQVTDLQRQFAYDRLLARVFTQDSRRWVLKGATAMLARLPTEARHSIDVDLYSRRGDLADAERALREAAGLDFGDYFRFELGSARTLTQGARATRVPVTAYLGPTEFARFHVDLVADLSMTGEVDEVPPLIDIDLGLTQPRYRAYPVADHIAAPRPVAVALSCRASCPIRPVPVGALGTAAWYAMPRASPTATSRLPSERSAAFLTLSSPARRLGVGIQTSSAGLRDGMLPTFAVVPTSYSAQARSLQERLTVSLFSQF